MGSSIELCWSWTAPWQRSWDILAGLQCFACKSLALDTLLECGALGAGICMVARQHLGPFTILSMGYKMTWPI